MSLKFPKVLPAYAYRDPAGFVMFTITVSAGVTGTATIHPPASIGRDRYYTRAKRLHVKQLMKGKV